MVPSVPIEPPERSTVLELPRPDSLPDRIEPEAGVVVSGVAWQSYLDFDKRLGNGRPGPRFYYLQGELEIMTTSREHERIKEWIGTLMEFCFDSAELVTFSYEWLEARKAFRAALSEK